MPISTPFLVLLVIAAFLIVDVLEPIGNHVAKLRNRKYTLPLISAGLIEKEDDYVPLGLFLKEQGRTLENFANNGVPYKELKELKLQIELKERRLSEALSDWLELDQINSKENELLPNLDVHLAELKAEIERLENQMWGNLK